MKWEVRVQGPPCILHQVGLAVSDQDIRLLKRGDVFVLTGARLDALENAERVHEEADRIVSILSTSARLLLGSTESLHVASVAEVRAEGSSTPTPGDLLPNDKPGRKRTGTTPIDGYDDRNSWAQRSSLSRSVREALANPAMEKALRLRNTVNPSWSELLQVYEVIEEALGGKPIVASRFGFTEAAIGRLRHAAASTGANGDAAPQDGNRTATQPQPKPITLPEASRFVDRLLMAWLGSAALHHL